MQAAHMGVSFPPMEGAPPVDAVTEGEPVFKAAPVRVAASPGASGGIEGAAVLTSERLVVVPGAASIAVDRGAPLARALSSLWARVRPALLEAFPIARLISEPRHARSAQLAARARPGIEIPLEMIGRAFEARLPGWIGLELTLPPPDPRPPFALYLQVDAAPGPHREWADLIDAQRKAAPARPELERPYALFYLLQPPPRPSVRVRSSDGRRKGALTLHADGPAIASTFGEKVLVPYESITRLVFASATSWRRGHLVIEAGAHTIRIDPVKDWDAQRLHDSAQLLAEITGLPLRRDVGPVRAARVATAMATIAGTAAAVAWEILHSLP
jgi:hypothetical protein